MNDTGVKRNKLRYYSHRKIENKKIDSVVIVAYGRRCE